MSTDQREDQLAQIVGNLKGEAQLDSVGRFSLDRDKARSKLRQFRLPDPYRYVLLVVQVASLRGATRVDVDVDADDVRISFDGTPLSRRDFDELYGALFVDGRDPELQARRNLAVALDSAKSLATQFVVVESVGASGKGVRFTLTDEGETIEDIPAGKPGTRLHVRDRWSPSLMEEYFKARKGMTAEAMALRKGCALSNRPIFVNGERVSGGLQLEGVVIEPIAFETPHARGLVSFGGVNAPARMIVTSHGVIISTEQLDMPRGLVAVVDGSALRTDVSLTHVLHDEAYDAVLDAVKGLVDQALLALCDFQLAQRGEVDAATASEIRDRIYARAMEVSFEFRQSALLADPLAGCAVWPALGGKQSAKAVCLADGRCGHVGDPDPFPFVPEEFAVVLVAESGFERDRIEELFGPLGQDVSEPLARAVTTENNRRAWRARPHAANLGKRPSLARAKLAAVGGVSTGEVGASTLVERPVLLVIVDGCLLVELRGHNEGAPGFLGAVEGDFGINKTFDGVRHDGRLGRILATCAEAYKQAWHKAASEILHRTDGGIAASERKRLMAVLRVLTQPDFVSRFITAFGFEGRIADKYAANVSTGPLVLEPSDAALPWLGLDLFEAVDGRALRLTELLTTPDEPLCTVHAPELRVPTPHLVLALRSPEEREWLHAVTGRKVIAFDEDYARLVEKARFHQRPLETPNIASLRAEPVYTTNLNVGGLGGVVGIANTGRAKVRLLAAERAGGAGRFVVEHAHALAQPLLGVVSGPVVVPNASLDGLDVSAEEAYQAALAKLWAAMLRDLLDASGRASPKLTTQPAVRSIALRWLTMVFEAPVVWRAFQAEAEASGDAHAVACLRRWLRPGIDAQVAAEAALQQLGIEGADPGRPGIGGAEDPEGLSAKIRDEAASLVPLLARAPLFRRWDGAPVDIMTISAAGRRIGRIPVAQGPMERCRLELAVIADDADEIECLRRLFGDALDDAERMDRDLRRKARMSAAPAQKHEAFDTTERLVKTSVDTDGLEGELIIPMRPCPGPGRAHISLTYDDRPLEAMDVDSALPIEGRLEVNELESEISFDETSRPKLGVQDQARVRQLVRRRLNTLVSSLMGRWFKLEDEEKALASSWLLVFLADRISGTDGKKAAIRGKMVKRLYATPIVPTADGGWVSVERLSEDGRDEDGAVCVRTDRWTATENTDRPVALLPDPTSRAQFQRIFAATTTYDGVWAKLQLAQARRRSAPALPTVPPEDALAAIKLRRSGLRGWVWIDPVARQEGIAVGEDGREVARLRGEPPEALLGACGAVWGPAVEVAGDFSTARLPDRQWRIVWEAAAEAWAQLAEAAAEDKGPPRAFAGFARLRDMQRQLCSKVSSGETLTGDEQRVGDALGELRLIEMTSGTLVSLEWAKLERPFELSHLGLWEAPEYEPSEVDTDTSEHDSTPSRPAIQAEAAIEEDAEEAVVEEVVAEPPASDERLLWARLLEHVRDELRLARGEHQHLLADAALERLELADDSVESLAGRSVSPVVLAAGQVFVRPSHPVSRYALASFETDPTAASLLTSAVYTALRNAEELIDEAAAFDFHGLHAYLVLTRQGAR